MCEHLSHPTPSSSTCAIPQVRNGGKTAMKVTVVPRSELDGFFEFTPDFGFVQVGQTGEEGRGGRDDGFRHTFVANKCLWEGGQLLLGQGGRDDRDKTHLQGCVVVRSDSPAPAFLQLTTQLRCSHVLGLLSGMPSFQLCRRLAIITTQHPRLPPPTPSVPQPPPQYTHPQAGDSFPINIRFQPSAALLTTCRRHLILPEEDQVKPSGAG